MVKCALLLVFLLDASFADAYGYVPYGESGLRQGKARYLSNDLTRFTSVDPARESADPTIPQSWNRYAYSLNDPMNLIDPNGLEWFRAFYVYGKHDDRRGGFAHEASVDMENGVALNVMETAAGNKSLDGNKTPYKNSLAEQKDFELHSIRPFEGDIDPVSQREKISPEVIKQIQDSTDGEGYQCTTFCTLLEGKGAWRDKGLPQPSKGDTAEKRGYQRVETKNGKLYYTSGDNRGKVVAPQKEKKP